MEFIFPEEIPVSLDEINAWLDAIPNLSKLESRRQAYRVAYNVDNKIRSEKASGNYQPERRTCCAASPARRNSTF